MVEHSSISAGGSYLVKFLSEDQIEEEKKRHDIAVEKYRVAYEKNRENRTNFLDWIATVRVKEQAKQNFWMQIML